MSVLLPYYYDKQTWRTITREISWHMVDTDAVLTTVGLFQTIATVANFHIVFTTPFRYKLLKWYKVQ